MDFKDYYQTLGVARDASADDIKKAFRKLARKYHPDVSKEPGAEARMKEINEANAVLSDPEKRALYDQMGSGHQQGQPFQPQPGWDSNFEFSGADAADSSDFFASLFGRAGGARRSGAYRMRGEDHHAKVDIDLQDAYRGARRTISLRRPRVNEHGQVVLDDHTLEVHIPKGVKEGQHIRLSGQGAPGEGGAPAGDLYLEIRFTPDARYRIDGRDVHETVPVTPWEAALGGPIEVPTPSGPVTLTVPAGSQTGRKLRLKSRGIPGDPPGDLYVVLEVVLPPADNDTARRLYETMARDLHFDPRRTAGA